MATPVSILICTRNRADHLKLTLASVAALVIPETLTPELIVVDNGSTDATVDMVHAAPLSTMPVRLVQEPRPGLSLARNAALRAARGEVLLFTDDDVRLPPDWLGAMCAPILAGEADAVAGKVVLAPHLHRPWMRPFHRIALASTEYMKEDHPGVLFGASMAFSRRVLDKVPAFDPELGAGRLGAGEETLFAWQLLQAGFTITTAFEAAVEHHPDPDRLSRAAYLAMACSRARAQAYIRYHWSHAKAAQWRHRFIPSVRLTWLMQALHLLVWRLVHWKASRTAEGIHEEEFTLAQRMHRTRQYLRERKRPRHYEPFGLIKLDTVSIHKE